MYELGFGCWCWRVIYCAASSLAARMGSVWLGGRPLPHSQNKLPTCLPSPLAPGSVSAPAGALQPPPLPSATGLPWPCAICPSGPARKGFGKGFPCLAPRQKGRGRQAEAAVTQLLLPAGNRRWHRAVGLGLLGLGRSIPLFTARRLQEGNRATGRVGSEDSNPALRGAGGKGPVRKRNRALSWSWGSGGRAAAFWHVATFSDKSLSNCNFPRWLPARRRKSGLESLLKGSKGRGSPRLPCPVPAGALTPGPMRGARQGSPTALCRKAGLGHPQCRWLEGWGQRGRGNPKTKGAPPGAGSPAGTARAGMVRARGSRCFAGFVNPQLPERGGFVTGGGSEPNPRAGGCLLLPLGARERRPRQAVSDQRR